MEKLTDAEVMKCLESRMPFDEVCCYAYDLIKRKDAEIERLKEKVSRLKHEMSYMKSPNTIGDRHEMGCW